MPELLRGIPDPFMSARLVEAVGIVKAKYLFFVADEIDAETAERMGLVAVVVPHDELGAEVERVLERISQTGPVARAQTKADMVNRLPRADLAVFERAMTSPEMREGMAAFVQKRPVEWPRG